ncbi:MAG: hypothetical protein GSR73_04040 [Desulfurococcales archaeon]|nr:hypothetical protein [Desulfurococcales archaeon]
MRGPLLPQEYVARRILPLLRGAVASCLYARGVSQHRISRLLGVSQPMVHKYLRHGLDYYLDMLAGEGIARGTLKLHLDILCSRVAKGDSGEIALTANTLALQSNYCRGNRLCGATLKTGEPPEIRLYYEVLERLLELPIRDSIPEVGSNLAYAPRGSESIEDVVGLDGRIVKAATGVIVAGSPIKGGSKHTGRVALKYSRYWGSDAWATVLRYTPRAAKTAEARGDVAFEVELGEGVEPVIYIVSRDPLTLIEVVRDLVGSG